MRRTIVMLLLLVVVVWSAPTHMEDVSRQCRALERQVLREQARQTPEGAVDAASRAQAVAAAVAQYARDQHSTFPGGLACFLVYWEIMFDPDLSMFQPQAAP
jgi:hypothetical protein